MRAIDILAKLTVLGLTVTADGDAINVRPRERLTDELRTEIRQHKTELLMLLPRFRWLVRLRDGSEFEVCCLPETTTAEMAVLYRGATLLPLPDAPDWRVRPMVVETPQETAISGA